MKTEMHDVEDIRKFLFAGRALFTVVSKKTGIRFTYKVRKARDSSKNTLFVSVLSGPDNESSYGYIGYLYNQRTDKLYEGRKGKPDSTSFKALDWVMRNLDKGALESVEFYHSGKCGCCGRTLTVPESIETGLGPICAARQ